jgi:hypothetical protein
MNKFLRSLFKNTATIRKGTVGKRRVPLAVETLEDRLTPSAPGPDDARAQYLLELINELRYQPQEELQRLLSANDPQISNGPGSGIEFFHVDRTQLNLEFSQLTAKTPALAWNETLHGTAQAHTQLLQANTSFDHQLPGELDAGTRLTSAGFNPSAENIPFAYFTAFQAEANMAIDWGGSPGHPQDKYGMQTGRGHRSNLMSPNLHEIGIGIVDAAAGQVDPTVNPPKGLDLTGRMFITEDFGTRSGQGPFLVGTVFTDPHPDPKFGPHYGPGEGRGGLMVTATPKGGGMPTSVLTTPAGGYQLPLAPGDYTIKITAPGMSTPLGTATTTVGTNTWLSFAIQPVGVVLEGTGKIVQDGTGGTVDVGGSNTPMVPPPPVPLTPSVVLDKIEGLNKLDPGTMLPPSNPVQFNGHWYHAFTDGNENVHVAMSDDPAHFGDGTQLGQQARGNPALAVFQGNLYIAWTGTDFPTGTHDGSLNVAIVNTDGNGAPTGVSGKRVLPNPNGGDHERSAHAPALASHDNALFIAWAGTDSDRHLNVAFATDANLDFATHKDVTPERTDSPPSLVESAGQLFVTWTGTDNGRNVASVLLSSHTSQPLVTFPLRAGVLSINGDQLRAGANDTITLDRTAAGGVIVTEDDFTSQWAPGQLKAVVVNVGLGASNTVNVRGTAPGVPVTINSHGFTTVTVGNAGDMIRIGGDVTITGPAHSVDLDLDASKNVIAPALLISRQGYTESVTGLAPAAVRFWDNIPTTFHVHTGVGNNVVHVEDTPDTRYFTDLDLNGRTNTVYVTGTTGELFVNGKGGSDTVRLGSNTTSAPAFFSTVSGIRGLVHVSNPTGKTALIVDDHLDLAGHPAVVLDRGSLTGLAPAPVTWEVTAEAHGVTSLSVTGGSGADTYTVRNTDQFPPFVLPAPPPFQNLPPVTLPDPTSLVTGTGDDVVNVENTTGALNVTLGGVHDTVNFSPVAHFLQNVLGDVNVYGGDGTETINVYDQANGGNNNYWLTGSSINRTYTGTIAYQHVAAVNVFGGKGAEHYHIGPTLNGSPPPLGAWASGSALALTTGPGANQIDLVEAYSIGAGGLIQTSLDGPLTINGNSASDTLTVDETGAFDAPGIRRGGQSIQVTQAALDLGESGSGPNSLFGRPDYHVSYHGIHELVLQGGKAGTTFTVGNGMESLRGYPAGINVQGGGADPLTVRDQATLSTTIAGIDFNTTYTVTNQAVTRSSVPLGGFGIPATVAVHYSGLSRLEVNGSVFPTTFIVQNTAAGVPTTLRGGAGDDTFRINGGAAALAGRLSIDGGGGTNTLDYSGYTGPVTVNLPLGTATAVAGGIRNIRNVAGSRGNDILVGDGTGNVLHGGTGRNLLISGPGPGTLVGGSGDVLVGGSTPYDKDPTGAALAALMDEWGRTDLPYGARVDHLLHGGGRNGSTVLNGANFTPNAGHNTLTGIPGAVKVTPSDLYFGSLASQSLDKNDWNPSVGEVFVEKGQVHASTAINIGALSASRLLLDGTQWLAASSNQRLTLAPGAHTLGDPYTGESVTFAVSDAGTVSYDTALEGGLTGAGTSALTVQGRKVTIDATTGLSPVTLAVSYGSFQSTGRNDLQLLPGDYSLWAWYNSSAVVRFHVDPQGRVSYDAALGDAGILGGAGTSTLAVHGRKVIIDARPLSPQTLVVSYEQIFQSGSPKDLWLLPGDYFLYDLYNSSAMIRFQVDPQGRVSYDAALGSAGVLGGAGTSTLTVQGRKVTIDATLLSPHTLAVSYEQVFQSTSRKDVWLLPGAYSLYDLYNSSAMVLFTVNSDGSLSVPAAEGALLFSPQKGLLNVKALR